jgi:imidazolonepropionase-like amidohydrolase
MTLVVLEEASVLDAERGVVGENQSIVVEGDRIREVAEGAVRLDDARRIRLGGRTVMPGLIDAHVHVTITSVDIGAMFKKPTTLIAQEARVILERMLRRGFTTVRDAGGCDWGLAEAVERGLIDGPRVFHSGRVLSQTGGHGDFRERTDTPEICACHVHTSGFAHVADGVPAVRKAAREELRRGAKQVKIMASGGVASPTDPVWNIQYSAEEMRAIVEEANSWRTYAMAHAYTPEAITRAVDAGVRTIEHGNLIDAATAKKMADHGAYLVPTLVTYYKIEQLGRGLNFPEVSLRKVKDVLDAGLGSLAIAQAAGVKIGSGPIYSARRTNFRTRSSRFARERCRRRDHPLGDDDQRGDSRLHGRARHGRCGCDGRFAGRRSQSARGHRGARGSGAAPRRDHEERPLRGEPAG